MRKKKKSVLITGCSRGIGFHLASILAKKDYRVYANVRSKKHCSSLLNEEKRLENLEVVEFDVTEEKQVESFFSSLSRKHESIDVLFSNAASILFSPVECVSMSDV